MHYDEIAAGNVHAALPTAKSNAFHYLLEPFVVLAPPLRSRWPSSLYARWFPQEPTSLLLRSGQKMCLEGTR